MASPAQAQQDLLSFLDAIMACVENYPMFDIKNLLGSLGLNNASLGVNAMSLLMILVRKFCTEEEIINWFAKWLIYVLPQLEISLKGIMLSNLKTEISCNIDPWIPDKWRQKNSTNKSSIDAECLIPISSIDYRSIFNINPTSKKGQDFYFGSKIGYIHDVGNKYTVVSGETYNEVYEKVAAKASSESIDIDALVYANAALQPNNTDFLKKPYDVDAIKSNGDINSLYQLARADDMNAFLWLVINKGRYFSSTRTDLTVEENVRPNAVIYASKPCDFEGSYRIDDTTGNSQEIYLSGDIVSTKYDNCNSVNYLLCYDGDEIVVKTKDSIKKQYYSHLIPCSNRINSFNWYVDRNKYDNRNLGISKKNEIQERDYTNEFPLCNITCTDKNGDTTNYPSNNSFFQIQVLPRPMLHYQYWELTQLVNRDSTKTISSNPKDVILPFPFTKILFDEEGRPNSKGHFTIQPVTNGEGKIIKPTVLIDEHTKKASFRYKLQDNRGNLTNFELYCTEKEYSICYARGSNDVLYNLTTEEKDSYEQYKREFINSCLVPCYGGLSIYEFNFDFVMGMRLFEPRTIATRILKTLLNIRLGIDASLTLSESIQSSYLEKIIKGVMFSDQEITDCFFSFSNKQFTELLDEAERKRSQQYKFTDDLHTASLDAQEVFDTLNQFKDTATLEEKVDIIKGSMSEMSTAISSSIDGETSDSLSKDFIIDCVQMLGLALIETLLSPKVLLLFEVNQRIMGRVDRDNYPSLEELLTSFATLITGMIAEIQKRIIADLLDLAMKHIKPLLSKLTSMLTLEQLTFYRELLQKLIEACSISWSSQQSLVNTSLDVVRYADITETERPQTDKC